MFKKDEVMDKQFYQSLLPLVNDKLQFDTLKQYADHRIEFLRNSLETCKDQHRVLEIQGAIAELRRIATLRDEAIMGSG